MDELNMVHCLLNLWAPKWTAEQSDTLREFVLSGFSYAQSAIKINDQFGTHFTRNSAIGRAHRIGLSSPSRMKAPPKPRHRVYKPRPRPAFEVKPSVRCEALPGNVSLLDLADDGCRWAFGDGALHGSDFTFCNSVQAEGSSYCPAHFRESTRSDIKISDEERERRSLNFSRIAHQNIFSRMDCQTKEDPEPMP